MHGLMMDYPLTLTHILDRSAKLFPRQQISSKTPAGMHRYSYADFHRRVHSLAHVLAALGVQAGDRVGTLCWNSFRHLELYFAIPCYGAVMHTLNLRLPSDQLAYIINHAEDQVIFVDASLFSLLEPIRGQIRSVKHFVILPDQDSPTADYEHLLLSASPESYAWPRLDENTAAATCYTSGTTGHPKGVLYTHRALVLHSFALALADSFAISERDTVLQIVPMFHANGWGIPFAAVMAGSRIVFTGRDLQPAIIAGLIQDERATFTAGVPTIWMSLYAYLDAHPHNLSSLRMVVSAGSAMPRQFIEWYEKKYGVHFRLAWGMTETTPIATFMALKHHLEDLPEIDHFDLLARHGLPLPGVDIRIVDAEGAGLPWDGSTMGELQTRGPWVCSGYYNDPRGDESFSEGWFRTGDVATIDPEGYLQIMDRTKDLVKSGGEWIPSVDLENAIMAHPKVMEAAVISVFHPKWQERPLACIAPLEQYRGKITKQEILDFLAGKIAKWWLPDDIVFLDAVPKTSVGKFNKRGLREQFKGYILPSAGNHPDLQPFLKGDLLELRPLRREDFDQLYAVASDPLVWEQHPARDRYQEEVFQAFFREALESGGALIAIDTKNSQVIGSSRFHGYDEQKSEIEIGWSFLARSYWGGSYNREMKQLMLRHAFKFVNSVIFVVGPQNLRSQRALEKIGAVRAGSRPDGNLVYRISANLTEPRP